jgi:hypothetical protein
MEGALQCLSALTHSSAVDKGPADGRHNLEVRRMDNRKWLIGHINACETRSELLEVMVAMRLVRAQSALAHLEVMKPLGPLLGMDDVVHAAYHRVLVTADEARTAATEFLRSLDP